MGGLLLIAAGVFFGIIFIFYVLSSAFELAGGWGLLLLVAAIMIGFAIAASSDKGGKK